MKIIGYPATASEVHTEVLNNPNVHGIAIWLGYSKFLMMNGYYAGAIKTLCEYLLKIRAANKEATLLIQFGSAMSTPSYNTYESIEYVRIRGLKPEERTFIKVPVFYNEQYFQEVYNFIEWFSDNLKKNHDAYDTLTQVKVVGVHATSLDFRADSQDYTNTTDPNRAYVEMATLWLANDWDTQNSINYCKKYIKLTTDYFQGKEICLPINNNIFPCIDMNNEVCLPNERPDVPQVLTDYLMQYCGKPSPQITYFGKTITPLACVKNSGSKFITYQTNTNFNKLPAGSGQVIRDLITNAEKHNCNKLELFSISLRNTPVW